MTTETALSLHIDSEINLSLIIFLPTPTKAYFLLLMVYYKLDFQFSHRD